MSVAPMKINCSFLLDSVPFGPKEVEGSTVDDLAKAIARDYQYFVAMLERGLRGVFSQEQHQRSVAKISVRVEYIDEATDNEKAALQRLATEYMRGERYSGLDREVEIDFHFHMPISGPLQ
jgi:hypothetical protein